jgi:hypothetical protein
VSRDKPLREGTGVAPDVETPADEALERAKALALKALGRG